MAPRRNARGERSRSASPTESEEEREPFDYKRPKPAVLQSAGLCVWENAAVFCEPRDVAQMELVCRDVNDRLREQSTGTRLMQRYWNLQWAVMVWSEAEISADKRQLLPTSLTRTEGKKNWKKMFVVEYPDWVQRTFQGKGISNNANNAAKTLFHREELNTKRSAAQLAKMELTVDEAIQKAEKKRGVVVEMDDGTTMASDDGSGPSSPLNGKRGPNGRRNEDGNRKPLIRIPKKVVTENFSRQDYQDDKRQGDRKGKHAKGGEKRWSSFGGGEDDYY